MRAADPHDADAPRLSRPVDRRRRRAAARDLPQGRDERDFESGIRAGARGAALVAEVPAARRARAGRRRPRRHLPAERSRARVAPVVLPLAAACRTTSCSRSPRAAAEAIARCSSSRCGGCSPTTARGGSSTTSPSSGSRSATCMPSSRRSSCQFDSTLRDAMVRETELFFESQVRDDRPIQDLLRANYTFLNERLAQHYGIPDVFGSHFRRVTLTDERSLRPARPGERPHRDLVRRPDLGGAARQMDPREPARRAAAAAAAQRAAAQGKQAGREAGGAPRADGAAPQQPGLRELPLADGSARLRARALRRDRPLARDRRRRADQLDDRLCDGDDRSTSPKDFREALLAPGRRVRRARSPRRC